MTNEEYLRASGLVGIKDAAGIRGFTLDALIKERDRAWARLVKAACVKATDDPHGLHANDPVNREYEATKQALRDLRDVGEDVDGLLKD